MLLPADRNRLQRKVHSEVDSPTGGKQMGLVYAEIELVSVDDIVLHRRGFLPDDKIKRLTVNALVDTGAYMLIVTDQIRKQLDLPLIEEQVFRLADDSECRCEVVGPVEVHFENRSTTVRAVVLPGANEVLLGSIPMEDLDVLVDPKQQRLIVNPESPEMAMKYLK
ncbi:MAG TPA: retroviral-like aspartic protease family protein [Pyrinomonadaceae bacterium]|nr:retroviral-like aspartic protease family protein [Pyrinomonadaceae bacterium]